MASSIAAITMPRSIDFSRATASAICSSSSLLALTAMVNLLYRDRFRLAARLRWRDGGFLCSSEPVSSAVSDDGSAHAGPAAAQARDGASTRVPQPCRAASIRRSIRRLAPVGPLRYLPSPRPHPDLHPPWRRRDAAVSH